jgi:hypothetical protein
MMMEYICVYIISNTDSVYLHSANLTQYSLIKRGNFRDVNRQKDQEIYTVPSIISCHNPIFQINEIIKTFSLHNFNIIENTYIKNPNI